MMALLFNYAGHLRGACAGETKSGNHQSSLAILLTIRFRGGSGAEPLHAALLRAQKSAGRGRKWVNDGLKKGCTEKQKEVYQ